jgi:CheY-like chemotaxis protein/signal transduction histidine kinase
MEKLKAKTGLLSRATYRKRFGRLGLRMKLLIWILVCSSIPVIVDSYIQYKTGYEYLQIASEKALGYLSDNKTQEIEYYFEQILQDLKLQSEMNANTVFLNTLIKARRQGKKQARDFVKSYQWALINVNMGVDLKTYREIFGYHDIFLVDAAGNILYTITNKTLLGENIFDSQLSSTLFTSACLQTLNTGEPAFSDYEELSTPESEGIFGFVASAIINDEGEKIGLIAFQFSNGPIDEIVKGINTQENATDIYVIGSDLVMRTNSRLSKEPTALVKKVMTTQSEKWKSTLDLGNALTQNTYLQNGQAGVNNQQTVSEKAMIYKGPLGNTVLGIHRSISIQGVQYSIIAEVDEDKAFASVTNLRNTTILLLAGIVSVILFISFFISRSIVRPIVRLSSFAKKIAKGELDLEIRNTSSDEVGELGESFNEMIANLRTSTAENSIQDWLKSGQNDLAVKMRGEQDIGTLANSIIGSLVTHTQAQIGALYLADDSLNMKLVGSYAFNKRKDLSNEFKPGEGLIGQVALEKKHIILTRCPEDYISIKSGLGDAVPSNIAVFPIMTEDEVKGIMELGSFNEFDEHTLNFLESVSESIAITFQSVSARLQTEQLLLQTREQARDLQVREEELKQINEELESQSDALKESQSRLQKQQEKLRQTNEELEEHKEETERKNRELVKTQKLVEEKAQDLEISSKYKSEFLANMSHELRTPLNSILLLSKLLSNNKEGNLTPDDTESAEAIHSSGSDLLTLINEILDLSKIESGKMELHLDESNIPDCIDSMKKTFLPLAQDKNLEMNFSFDDQLPKRLKTDWQRVQQIIKNFLSNALKFTSSGSVSLDIERPRGWHREEPAFALSTLEPQRTIVFSVTDTGLGIPEEKQKIIFEAFQQADGSTSRRFGGTGLGLSISKELAKLLGGQIVMKSTEGKGSTFSLLLPETDIKKSSSKNAADKGAPQSPKKTQDSTPEITGKNKVEMETAEIIHDDRKLVSPGDKSILIIEDDPKFLRILRDLSREQGFKCLVAGDGETGLHFADYYNPSAIILDIGLPRIDGWTVMNRLKENPKTRHIPVHFISASDDKLDAMKMGAVDYLVKPVSLETLKQMYERLDHMISKSIKDLLVVEDDQIQQKAIAKTIGNGDVKITFASTGKEAYDLIVSNEFDCIVLDLGLPDMSGMDLLSSIRGNDQISTIPIIIFTGRELSNDESALLDEYAETTIIKNADSSQKLLNETTLFLHRVETDLPEEQQKILKMMHDKDAILSDKKVLLVDDDMRNVYSLKRILEEKNMQIIVGKNGREGIERLNDNPDINLVLMDIMMPEMDGYEAMQEIRKQLRFKELPIIALTAKAMKGDRKKCIERGASDYLAKPVDTDRLFSMLRVWLYG